VVSAATTDHMVSRYVPSAAQYPRRDAGHKGAYRRRDAMALAPPLPPSPRRAPRPGPGNRAGAGSSGEEVRALCVPYVGGTYGLSRLITVSRKPLLSRSVLSKLCSSQALDTGFDAVTGFTQIQAK
jgi:hypothetical protein